MAWRLIAKKDICSSFVNVVVSTTRGGIHLASGSLKKVPDISSSGVSRNAIDVRVLNRHYTIRLGDREWVIFDQPSGFIEQMMFHKGKFYVLRRQEYLLNGCTENIVVYAFDSRRKLALYTLSTIYSNCWFKRTVESGGELLKVVGGIAIVGSNSLKLNVFKLAEKQQGGG